MGRCEIFDRKRCFGCVGLDPQHDIEKNKLLCEDYQKFLKKYDEGEQMKL